MNPLTARWLVERPDAPALLTRARTWSWAELDAESKRCAGALRALGIQAGDRVGVISQNRAELVFLVHAAARAGIQLVFLNARLTESECLEQLARARCKLALVDGARGELGLPTKRIDALAVAPPIGVDVSVAPSRPLVLLYTSGTTGRPKAAMLSLEALVTHARASAAHLGATASDVHLCNLPLFHVGGLSMIFRAAECGGALLLHERFDAAAVLADLAARPVTHLSVVATTLARLLDALGDRPMVAPHLRVVLVGGGPLPDPLCHRAERCGFPLVATYGLTEACSQVATGGRALPGVELRVVDAARAPIPAGEVGDIEVRSAALMLGYDADPEATLDALADGWLRTRDLGVLDSAGALTVHARRSDLILSGGENVYPAEIEAALLGLPGVLDAGVVARPDSRWGQVPIAAVVLGTGVDAASLEAPLASRLAKFKRPRSLVALPELPRNAAGKLERGRLRELLGVRG